MCDKDSISCPKGTCLSSEKRCDGQVHCSDGSDEPITCGRFEMDHSGGDYCLTPLLLSDMMQQALLVFVCL